MHRKKILLPYTGANRRYVKKDDVAIGWEFWQNNQRIGFITDDVVADILYLMDL